MDTNMRVGTEYKQSVAILGMGRSFDWKVLGMIAVRLLLREWIVVLADQLVPVVSVQQELAWTGAYCFDAVSFSNTDRAHDRLHCIPSPCSVRCRWEPVWTFRLRLRPVRVGPCSRLPRRTPYQVAWRRAWFPQGPLHPSSSSFCSCCHLQACWSKVAVPWVRFFVCPPPSGWRSRSTRSDPIQSPSRSPFACPWKGGSFPIERGSMVRSVFMEPQNWSVGVEDLVPKGMMRPHDQGSVRVRKQSIAETPACRCRQANQNVKSHRKCREAWGRTSGTNGRFL